MRVIVVVPAMCMMLDDLRWSLVQTASEQRWILMGAPGSLLQAVGATGNSWCFPVWPAPTSVHAPDPPASPVSWWWLASHHDG